MTAVRLVEKGSVDGPATPPRTLILTRGPVPLELYPGWTESVAPGQWTTLVVYSLDPLRGAERAEAEFEQSGRTLGTPIPDLTNLRVRVPAQLSPGVALLRTRVWRDGVASTWSVAEPFRVAATAASPRVDAARPSSHETFFWLKDGGHPVVGVPIGDDLVLMGPFGVQTARELAATFESERTRITLPSGDWPDFDSVVVRINGILAPGDYRVTITRLEDSGQGMVPSVIRVLDGSE